MTVAESDANVVDVGGACSGVVGGEFDAARDQAIPARERRLDLILGLLVASAIYLEGPERQVGQFVALQRWLRVPDAALIEHHEIATGRDIAREGPGDDGRKCIENKLTGSAAQQEQRWTRRDGGALEDCRGEPDPVAFGARSVLWHHNKAAAQRKAFNLIRGRSERTGRRLEARAVHRLRFGVEDQLAHKDR